MDQKRAEIIADKILKCLDRQSGAINHSDLSCVKVLVRIKDGHIQDPEISLDFRVNLLGNKH